MVITQRETAMSRLLTFMKTLGNSIMRYMKFESLFCFSLIISISLNVRRSNQSTVAIWPSLCFLLNWKKVYFIDKNIPKWIMSLLPLIKWHLGQFTVWWNDIFRWSFYGHKFMKDILSTLASLLISSSLPLALPGVVVTWFPSASIPGQTFRSCMPCRNVLKKEHHW